MYGVGCMSRPTDAQTDRPTDPMSASLLTVTDLRKQFPAGRWFPGRKHQYVRAVDGVSFSIPAGKTLGLVGESGCGKTTVGRLIARLLEPSSGSMMFNGEPYGHLRGSELRRFRPRVQVVFQDPYNSLNPRMRIEKIVAESMWINRWGSRLQIRKRCHELMEAVGLASQDGDRFAHELSGGQRQRVAIARALALSPKLVVCDEPVSALDVSIQAKILNLLMDLQQHYNLTYLFISHDLSVVRLIADHVAVMYLGQLVEYGTVEQVLESPLHPYTSQLLAAVPDTHRRSVTEALPGEVPSNISPPTGCRFHTRCPQKLAECDRDSPTLQAISGGHSVACFLHHSVADPARGDPDPQP